MTRFRHISRPSLLILLLFLAFIPEMRSQRFSVESFRMLPNDISAFINPVRDLNDEDCGLIKVIASPDFAFSTPLGIVRREDKTGEIWLYVPRGTKKLTLKHPEWGVLRDYILPSRIDSHITCELVIRQPEAAVPAFAADERVLTLTDTLIVTRVDTLMVDIPRPSIPLEVDVLASLGFGGRTNDLSGGLRVIVMKRHGGYLHAASGFGRVGATIGECGRTGEIDGRLPFYSGKTRRSSFMATAGGAHRIGRGFAVIEGIGYYTGTLAWQLAPSEGGGYVRNTWYSHSGLCVEAGAAATFGRVTVGATVMTVKGTDWFGTVGIGIRIGK